MISWVEKVVDVSTSNLSVEMENGMLTKGEGCALAYFPLSGF